MAMFMILKINKWSIKIKQYTLKDIIIEYDYEHGYENGMSLLTRILCYFEEDFEDIIFDTTDIDDEDIRHSILLTIRERLRLE